MVMMVKVLVRFLGLVAARLNAFCREVQVEGRRRLLFLLKMVYKNFQLVAKFQSAYYDKPIGADKVNKTVLPFLTNKRENNLPISGFKPLEFGYDSLHDVYNGKEK